MENEGDLSKLKSLLLKSRHCVALTGAGISTMSGLRDFRGKWGLHRDKDSEKIFDSDHFTENPSLYYEKTKDLIYNLRKVKANSVHKSLARLEEIGILKGVITQNIDMLHQLAGSKKVIELHGSPKIHFCLHCDKEYDYNSIAKTVQNGKVPRCICGGLIKPNIVFFGDKLPKKELEEAQKLATKSDLMFVLGSSLTVQPAASIPLFTLKKGGKIIIVNDTQTPLDREATLRFKSLKEVFDYIEKEI